jgi:DmsE family decaheme c-type cytochrome
MKESKNLKQHLIWVGVVALILLGAGQLMAAKQEKADKGTQATTQMKAGKADSSQYVGAETCKGCHEGQFKNVEATPHYKTSFAKGRGEDWHGCESCHGPGAAHVEGGGDKTKIFTFKDVKPNEVTERCMTCHQTNVEHASFNRSVHNKNGISCLSCHSAHKAKEQQFLLTQKQPDLCYSCHNEQKAEFVKPFRHRVNEGLVTCSDCHNVHGGSASKQLRATASQEAVCFKCHSDKKGPFVFEHEPIKSEGCMACHTPHGSTNPRLLSRARVNSLCLECHGNIPAGPHPQNTRSQACILCHSNIHGSNTSNVFFKN